MKISWCAGLGTIVCNRTSISVIKAIHLRTNWWWAKSLWLSVVMTFLKRQLEFASAVTIVMLGVKKLSIKLTKKSSPGRVTMIISWSLRLEIPSPSKLSSFSLNVTVQSMKISFGKVSPTPAKSSKEFVSLPWVSNANVWRVSWVSHGRLDERLIAVDLCEREFF